MSGVVGPDPEEALGNFRKGRAEAVVLIEHAAGTNEQAPESRELLSSAGSEGGCWTWVPRKDEVFHLETKLEKWRAACIYQVPTRIRDQNRSSYTPQVVSFGPFHHGKEHLLPIEEHKRRVLLHCLNRPNAKPLADFIEAITKVAEKLESMYHDLPVQWSGERNRGCFVEMMIMDGCFMLEVIRMATGRACCDYESNDPIFGIHAHVNTLPYVRRDMLLIENQLPLFVLENLVAVESSKQPSSEDSRAINEQVLKFLSPSTQCPENLQGRLHPLDIFHYSRIHGEMPSSIGRPILRTTPSDEHDLQTTPTSDISAMALHDAGIQLRKVNSKNLKHVSFAGRTLRLPTLTVNELTQSIFNNLIAFERLHVPLTSFPVIGYVFLMSQIIKSSEDVSLLESRRIIRNALGDNQMVVELFMQLSGDLHVYPKDSPLLVVHQLMDQHCQTTWRIWRAHIARRYFRSPWAPISLAGSVFFLLITVARNIYGLTQHRVEG
ncbi:unnamed protein product [Urochloa decumbens]|uniref:Uncharacterized protein n=1 Tax=Urochloa decumbens TaxID=240449 RepID=A0ABC9B5P3_9POAL